MIFYKLKISGFAADNQIDIINDNQQEDYMTQQFIEAVNSGLQGRWIHVDPKKALAGLTPDKARQTIKPDMPNCWQLLHHLVIWLETFLDHIKGSTLDWDEIEKNHQWPTTESMQDDANFSQLMDRFDAGMDQAKQLIDKVDLNGKSSGFPELTNLNLYLVLLQHCSYHIGQIISVRKFMNDWH